jgi:hypothetical protein
MLVYLAVSAGGCRLGFGQRVGEGVVLGLDAAQLAAQGVAEGEAGQGGEDALVGFEGAVEAGELDHQAAFDQVGVRKVAAALAAVTSSAAHGARFEDQGRGPEATCFPVKPHASV